MSAPLERLRFNCAVGMAEFASDGQFVDFLAARRVETERDELRAEVERLKAGEGTHEEQFAQHQSESAACLEIYTEWQAERFQSACNALAAHVRQQAHISANAEYAILLLEQAIKEKNDAIKLAEDEQDRAVYLRGLLEAPHADTARADELAIELALSFARAEKAERELYDAVNSVAAWRSDAEKLPVATAELALYKRLYEQRNKEHTETLADAVKVEEERNQLREELARADAQLIELRAALHDLVAMIECHEIESLGCDRDGEEYCNCLRDMAKKAKKLV